MRTDGIYETKRISLKRWKSGQELKLVPFGDVHRDSPAFSLDAWQRFLERGKELAKQGNVLFLGMGDYFDGYSTSERTVVLDPRLHESSVKRHEQDAETRIKQLGKELSFMEGHLIGLMGGNHFFPFHDGSTSDNHLARMLATDYLGACCAIRISFELDQSKKISLDVFAHHGKGGGTTAGGRFNAVEKLGRVCAADIYLMGDNHARGCFPAGDLLKLIDIPNGMIVKAKPMWIGRTGSFLRGYVKGQSSYVVDAAMPPTNLGHIEFAITPRRSREDGQDIMDLHIGATQ